MTKPAAVFLQIVGLVVMIIGVLALTAGADKGIVVIVIGTVPMFLGGLSIRKRMIQDQNKMEV